MRWGGMSRASHQNAWVAAFLAIVLKLMALPMASAFGTLSLEQLLTGSFCSSGGVQQVSLTLEKKSHRSPPRRIKPIAVVPSPSVQYRFRRKRSRCQNLSPRSCCGRPNPCAGSRPEAAGHRSTLEPLQHLMYDRVYLSPLLPVVTQASSMHSGGSTVKGDIGEAQKWLMYVKV